MKLQILIPQYKEDDSVIQPLLDSIALQRNVAFDDIGVTIASDGGLVLLDKSIEKDYPYELNYIMLPHGGVSATRNALLDMTDSDYVMWCDADDMFWKPLGLYEVMNAIDDGFDYFNSVFIEENTYPLTGKPCYLKRENDGTFVHGKVYRRRFLEDKGIRWNDALTVHEDSYFNVLCAALSEKTKYCTEPFYLWCWRDGSVCRKDPIFKVKTYDKLLDSNSALIREFLRRGMREYASMYAVMMIYSTYYEMNKSVWSDDVNRDHLAKAEVRFADYLREFSALAKEFPKEQTDTVIYKVREKAQAEGLLLERTTFNDWIARFGIWE